MILKEAWEERRKLCNEGKKLRDEGHKLWYEGYKLWKEGNKLWKEGDRLYNQAVDDFFEPGAVINWQTGEVNGTPLPIPIVELLKGLVRRYHAR